MKTTLKPLSALGLFIALILLMSRCNSSAPKEVAIITPADSTAVADSGKLTVATRADSVAVPVVDSVAPPIPLTLIISNLVSDTCPVIVGIYGLDNKFPDPKDELKEYKFRPHGKKLIAKIKDLKFGTYALATYQDSHSKGKISKNLIGIPTDPYAFSNNYKPTVKAPNFNDCKFEYDAKSNTITMNMIR